MLPEILAVTLPKTRNSTNRPLDRLIGPGPVLYRQCSMLSVEWAAPETRLHHRQPFRKQARPILARPEIGRASCRERVCQYVLLSVVAVSFKKKKERSITKQRT